MFKEWIDDGIPDFSDVADFPQLVEEEEKILNLRGIMKKYLVFEIIPVTELLHYIKVAFRDDLDLLSNIHISPGDLEHCANHTFASITDYGLDGLVFLKVCQCTELQDEINFDDVGFLVIRDNPNCLVSFGLNITYRSDSLKKEWLEKIRQLFVPVDGIPYVAVVHEKNVRAINFFKRNGFNIQFNSDKTVGLWQSFSQPQLA